MSQYILYLEIFISRVGNIIYDVLEIEFCIKDRGITSDNVKIVSIIDILRREKKCFQVYS